MCLRPFKHVIVEFALNAPPFKTAIEQKSDMIATT